MARSTATRNKDSGYAFDRKLPSLQCVGGLAVMHCENCGCVKTNRCEVTRGTFKAGEYYFSDGRGSTCTPEYSGGPDTFCQPWPDVAAGDPELYGCQQDYRATDNTGGGRMERRSSNECGVAHGGFERQPGKADGYAWKGPILASGCLEYRGHQQLPCPQPKKCWQGNWRLSSCPRSPNVAISAVDGVWPEEPNVDLLPSCPDQSPIAPAVSAGKTTVKIPDLTAKPATGKWSEGYDQTNFCFGQSPCLKPYCGGVWSNPYDQARGYISRRVFSATTVHGYTITKC